tara:strand:- start:1967 stop:2170 length:204 start_codon:yes stop_codon:yes gene_type:complete
MSKKTYEVHWNETNDFRMKVKAKSKEEAEELFDKWYRNDYEKKVKPKAEWRDGRYYGPYYTVEINNA